MCVMISFQEEEEEQPREDDSVKQETAAQEGPN